MPMQGSRIKLHVNSRVLSGHSSTTLFTGHRWETLIQAHLCLELPGLGCEHLFGSLQDEAGVPLVASSVFPLAATRASSYKQNRWLGGWVGGRGGGVFTVN